MPHAPPNSPGGRLRRAAPRVVLGSAMFVGAGAVARRGRVPDAEQQVFHTFNRLPEHLRHPVWLVMQSGSLAGVGLAAGAAAVAGRRRTATALAVAGGGMWGGAKLVKRAFGRGRPAAHLDGVRVRGRPQTGLGFPSGHAAVAVAMATVAAPTLPRPVAFAVRFAAAVTVASRLYVGAHLPADVVGGAGLGLATGALTEAVLPVNASRCR